MGKLIFFVVLVFFGGFHLLRLPGLWPVLWLGWGRGPWIGGGGFGGGGGPAVAAAVAFGGFGGGGFGGGGAGGSW
jgi:uncharacterized protein